MSRINHVGDDDFVAKLLAEDAKKSSLRYSSMGMSALLDKRPISTAPKPNTRFLKSLVREADNHNAALKRREESEARQRLQNVNKLVEGPEGRSDNRRVKKARLRHEDGYRERNDRTRRRTRDANSEGRRGLETNDFRSRKKRDYQSSESTDNERHHRKKTRKTYKSSNHSNRERPDHRNILQSSRTRYSSSPDSASQHQRSRSEDVAKVSNRSPDDTLTPARAESTEQPRQKRRINRSRPDRRSDSSRSLSVSSDPLETIIGPLPPNTNPGSNDGHRGRHGASPVRQRGRGVYKPSRSTIDVHFSKDYEPALDVHPESEVSGEAEDWDMALEALRDRQQWKQKHVQRLREAGFGDAEISKWSDSGKEKTGNDVRWRTKGEAREWDIGKPDLDDLDHQERKARRKKNAERLADGWTQKENGFQQGLRKALG